MSAAADTDGSGFESQGAHYQSHKARVCCPQDDRSGARGTASFGAPGVACLVRGGKTESSSYLGERDHFGAQGVDVALCQEEPEEQGARSPTLGVDPVGDAGVGVGHDHTERAVGFKGSGGPVSIDRPIHVVKGLLEPVPGANAGETTLGPSAGYNQRLIRPK